MQELRGVLRGSSLSSSSDTKVGCLQLDCDTPWSPMPPSPAGTGQTHSHPSLCKSQPHVLTPRPNYRQRKLRATLTGALQDLLCTAPQKHLPPAWQPWHRIPILSLLKLRLGTHWHFALQGAEAARASARVLLRAQKYRKAAVF